MFNLLLKAELSGYTSLIRNAGRESNIVCRVTNLRPLDTEENPFWFMFKVQCTSCRETHSNHIGVNRFVSISPTNLSIGSLTSLGNERYQWQPRRGQLRLEVQELQGGSYRHYVLYKILMFLMHSASLLPPSKLLRLLTSKQSRLLPRRSSSLIVAVLSSPNSWLK